MAPSHQNGSDPWETAVAHVCAEEAGGWRLWGRGGRPQATGSSLCIGNTASAASVTVPPSPLAPAGLCMDPHLQADL